MNIFKRLFKMPNPYIKNVWDKDSSEMQQMIDKKFKKGFPKEAIVTVDKTFSKSGEIILVPSTLKFNKDGKIRPVEINKFPKLTKSEMYLFTFMVKEYPITVSRDSIDNYFGAGQSRQLLELIKKGYIKRVKRGEYQLTFVKYD